MFNFQKLFNLNELPPLKNICEIVFAKNCPFANRRGNEMKFITQTRSLLLFWVLLIKPKASIESKAVRLNPFEMFEPDTRLEYQNSSIETIRFPSRSGCMMACTRHELCRSVNFCDRQTCELNKEDVFSTEGVP